MSLSKNSPSAVIEVGADQLQGPGVVPCPPLGSHEKRGGHGVAGVMPESAAWNQHPRVYIDLTSSGEGQCPYCGAVYRLKAGVKTAAH
jgi:uncharacterized Zn-finger protein